MTTTKTYPLSTAANSPRLTVSQITDFALWVMADSVVADMALRGKAHFPAATWDEHLLSYLDIEVYDSAETDELVQVVLDQHTTLPELLGNLSQYWSERVAFDEAAHIRYQALRAICRSCHKLLSSAGQCPELGCCYHYIGQAAPVYSAMQISKLTPEYFAKTRTPQFAPVPRHGEVQISANTDGSYMIRIEDASGAKEINLTAEQFAKTMTGTLGKGVIRL